VKAIAALIAFEILSADHWYAVARAYSLASGKNAENRGECLDEAAAEIGKATKAGYRNLAKLKADRD